MSDEMIDGLWVRAAEGWGDERTKAVAVNLGRADALIARQGEKSHQHYLYAGFGLGTGDGGHGVMVQLALPQRSYPSQILKDLDKLVEALNARERDLRLVR